MAKLYNPILGTAKKALSQDSLNAIAAYQYRNNNLPSDPTGYVNPQKPLSQVAPVSAVSNYKAVKPILSPSSFRNASPQTKVTNEQQEKNTQTYLGELQGKQGNIAALSAGLAGGLMGAGNQHMDSRVKTVIESDPKLQHWLTGGKVGGTVAQFAAPYGAASGLVGKGVAKALPNVGKIGQGIAKSVATDLTVGLPLNINQAVNAEGLKGKEALKSVGINTAIDLITGGVLEVAPILLKSGKKVATKADFDSLPTNEQAEVIEQVRLLLPAPKETESQLIGENKVIAGGQIANRVFKPIEKDQYLNGLAEQIGNLETPMWGNYNSLHGQSIMSKANALSAEMDKVYKMSDAEFADYARAKGFGSHVSDLNTKPRIEPPLIFKKQVSETDLRNEALRNTMNRVNTAEKVPNLTVQPQKAESGTSGSEEQMFAKNGDSKLVALGADTNRINESATAKNIQDFGAFPPRVENNIQVPKGTAFGDTQQHADTLINSSLTDNNMKERLLEAVNDGDFTKVTVTNKKALQDADYEMKKGIESARTRFDSVTKSEKMPKSDDIALGYKLMKQYQEDGRYEDALNVAEDLSEMLSETGRTLQAARMVNLLTPDGRMRMLGKMTTRMKKQTGLDIKLSDDTLAAVKNAKSEKEVAEANKKAFIEVWNQIPPTWGEKLNAWRYMSMLFNPKTHLRNIVGNAIFVPVRTLKNTIGTGLESLVIKNGEKTKAILTRQDKELIDFAKSDYPNVEGMLKNETKFSDTMRDHDAKVFNSVVLEGIRKANGGALDKEDIFFLSKAYNSSLAQYMKANGLKVADMQGVTLDKARKYAMNEAAKATYRDTSEFATKLNQTKRDLLKSDNGFKKVLGVALEGTVPFTKTPTNILKRGVEYSPVGLLNGANKLRKALAKGESPVEALDNLAAGLSGSAILGLGAWLNHIGILQGANDDPYGTKKNAYETMQGQQEYSFNFGDKSYTVDWAAPVSMPLFVGAELYKSLSEGGMSFSKITDGILSVAEPMLNLSMLQGINEAVKTGFNDNAMFSVAETAISGYASQFVPTLFGQVARSTDQTRRSTTSTAESTTQRQLEKFKNKQIAKIPVLNRTLEPSVDLWGREDKNGGAVENFLSPGYYKKQNVTPVDKKLNELAGKLDSETANKIYPRVTNRYDVQEDGQKYRMTEKELTQFKKMRGKYAYDKLNQLLYSGKYQSMSDKDKVKAITGIYDDALDVAKAQLINGRIKR